MSQKVQPQRLLESYSATFHLLTGAQFDSEFTK